MKKLKIPLIIFAVAIVFTVYFYTKQTAENEVVKLFTSTDISNAKQITCSYPQMLSVSYYGGQIHHSLPKPETSPIIFTFSASSESDKPQLSYLDATKTITTVPIIKLMDNEEKTIYIDGGLENYLSVHTIYKKLGVSSYTKNVTIFGQPIGSLAMGSCVGY